MELGYEFLLSPPCQLPEKVPGRDFQVLSQSPNCHDGNAEPEGSSEGVLIKLF